MSITFGEFKSQLFPCQYEVYIGDLQEGILAYCKRHKKDASEFEESSDIKGVAAFYRCDYEEKRGVFFLPKNYDVYTLAHETSHATHIIFTQIGGRSEGYSNEPEAYYQGWLMKEINDINSQKKSAKL